MENYFVVGIFIKTNYFNNEHFVKEKPLLCPLDRSSSFVLLVYVSVYIDFGQGLNSGFITENVNYVFYVTHISKQ